MRKAQEYIDLAIAEITAEVQKVLGNSSLSLPDKDSCILPLVQQKQILKQAKSDLDFLDERHKSQQHEYNKTCKLGKIRADIEEHSSQDNNK